MLHLRQAHMEKIPQLQLQDAVLILGIKETEDKGVCSVQAGSDLTKSFISVHILINLSQILLLIRSCCAVKHT